MTIGSSIRVASKLCVARTLLPAPDSKLPAMMGLIGQLARNFLKMLCRFFKKLVTGVLAGAQAAVLRGQIEHSNAVEIGRQTGL